MIFIPYILFLILLFLILGSKKISFLENFNIISFINNVPNVRIYVLLFFTTMVTQFYTLNTETLNWDINTFVVMGQDILRGNLPYERQFDNKGPLFYLLYSIPAISGKIYVVRIFNDLALSFLVCNMYLLSTKFKPNLSKIYKLIPPVYFLLYMSYPIGHAGMSEVYALLFISLGINSVLSPLSNKFKNFNTGLFFSISYLITQSVILLISGVSILIIYNIIKEKRFKQLGLLTIGASFPLVILIVIYAANDLLYVLLYTLFIFPIIYTSDKTSESYLSFIDHLTEYLYLENYFSLGLITIFIFIFFIIDILKKLFMIGKPGSNWLIVFLLTALSIISFFNVSVPWWHYLIYYFFFSSFTLLFLKSNKFMNSVPFLLLLCSLNVIPFMVRDNAKIISNFSNIEMNYPIYSDYKLLSSTYKVNSITALSNQLILYYFNLPSENYLVHPSNYQKESYINGLSKANLLKENEIENLIINGDSDLLICNQSYFQDCEKSEYYELFFQSDQEIYYFINKKTVSKLLK